jgi:hypothetical protein
VHSRLRDCINISYVNTEGGVCYLLRTAATGQRRSGTWGRRPSHSFIISFVCTYDTPRIMLARFLAMILLVDKGRYRALELMISRGIIERVIPRLSVTKQESKMRDTN